jgi:hypothetical protein
MALFQPKAITQLRQIAKLLYIRSQLLAQLIIERIGKTSAPPERQVEILHAAIASEAIRFRTELCPFEVPSHDLVLRCVLKLVWEDYRETFGRTPAWVEEGWIRIETFILGRTTMAEPPEGETVETWVGKELTFLISRSLNVESNAEALSWIYNYLMASLIVTPENLAYTDHFRQIDWPAAKLGKYAFS